MGIVERKKSGKSVAVVFTKVIIYEQVRENQARRDIYDGGGDKYRLQETNCLVRQNL